MFRASCTFRCFQLGNAPLSAASTCMARDEHYKTLHEIRVDVQASETVNIHLIFCTNTPYGRIYANALHGAAA